MVSQQENKTGGITMSLATRIRDKECALKSLEQWYEVQKKSTEGEIRELKLRLKEEENKIKSMTQTEQDHKELFKCICEKLQKNNTSIGLNYYSNNIDSYSTINNINCHSTSIELNGDVADILIELSEI